MRAALALTCLAATAAATGPALAEGGPKPAAVDAMAKAMTAAGCLVDQANQAKVLKSAGLTEAEGAAVIDVLVREGRARAEGTGAYRLEGCK